MKNRILLILNCLLICLQIDKIYLTDARMIYHDVTMDMIIALEGAERGYQIRLERPA